MHDDIRYSGQLMIAKAAVTARAICIGNELTDQIGDLRIGTAGHQRVWQIQASCYCLRTHGLAGTSLASKQKIPHRLLRCCSQLRMLTDSNNFMRDDVPVRKLRHHSHLTICQNTLSQLILIHEILMTDCPGNCCASATHLQDGEVAIHSACRRIASIIDGQR